MFYLQKKIQRGHLAPTDSNYKSQLPICNSIVLCVEQKQKNSKKRKCQHKEKTHKYQPVPTKTFPSTVRITLNLAYTSASFATHSYFAFGYISLKNIAGLFISLLLSSIVLHFFDGSSSTSVVKSAFSMIVVFGLRILQLSGNCTNDFKANSAARHFALFFEPPIPMNSWLLTVTETLNRGACAGPVCSTTLYFKPFFKSFRIATALACDTFITEFFFLRLIDNKTSLAATKTKECWAQTNNGKPHTHFLKAVLRSRSTIRNHLPFFKKKHYTTII